MTQNQKEETDLSKLTLWGQVSKYKWRISLTYILVLIESVLMVLFPLFIALAIQGLLEDSFQGVIQLAVIGLLQVIIRSARRFYDARTYSRIYSQLSLDMVEREERDQVAVSTIMAHTSLLNEFIEFLEWSMPELVGATITLFGILVIMADLDAGVFFACIGLLVLMVVVFASTGKLNLKLNASYNSQFERQMEALESRDRDVIKNYFNTLMDWNVKWLDLDTFNLMVVGFGVVALLVFTAVVVADPDLLLNGTAFAIVIYVFIYTSIVIALPNHIQQIIRLNEISGRVSK